MMSNRYELEELSKKQELALKDELIRVSENGSKMATNILIIAGGLILTYAVFSTIVDDCSSGKKNKAAANVGSQSKASSLLSQITQNLAEEAALFLLELVKKKLTSYLNATNESTG